MIRDLQSDAGSAELAMENGLNMVEKSVLDATQTGQDISEITNSIRQINLMNEQIATSAEEQSSVTEEINRNMVNIQDGYAEMQASYQILEEGCKLVDSLANELTGYLIEGDAVDIEISDKNSGSALGALRKLKIDYEIID